MHRCIPFALAFLVAAAVPSSRAAAAGAFARFRGGGPAHTDCMLVEDVAGVPAAAAAVCTDGDRACDADGVVDGTCTFTVRLCLDAPGGACSATVVTRADVSAASAAIGTLAADLALIPMPVSTPETCTDAAPVAVPTRGRRPGRLVVRASATMTSGRVDRDRLKLACRPPKPPPAFATIQRTIFDVSCATASCHGAGTAGGLGVTADVAYANLVGVPPANAAAAGAGLLRVAPRDPERSFLLAKLRGSLTADEGARMPQVGLALPGAKIDLVRRWILAGAPR